MIQPDRSFLTAGTAQRSVLLSRRGILAATTAALTAAGIPGLGTAQRFVLAQPATPMATPGPEQVAFFIQFVHFEKFLARFGGVLDEEQLAGLYGVDVETYRSIRGQFDASARRAAEELLADPDFAARVDRLPFAPGDTVVGLGDSITDDLQSWLEILRHLLALRRADDQIEIVNQGISGDTTTGALGRLIPILLFSQPAWIICMLGTNDAMRNGLQATKTRVSLDETTRNLTELRHLATTESAANWAWITAPPCDEASIAADPLAAQFEFSLSNDDIVPIAEFIRDQPEPSVDLVALFGVPPSPELMMQDGIHPSLAGQQATARTLVESLTE